MKRDAAAKLLTAALFAGLVAFVVARQTGWSPQSQADSAVRTSAKRDDPRETIYAMLEAAKGGEVAAYLDCFSGEIAQRIEQSRREMSDDAFSEYLKTRDGEIKGVAISDVDNLSPDSASIELEYVFADRNESQRLRLTKVDGAWKISGMDAAERVNTAIPYGTPVY